MTDNRVDDRTKRSTISTPRRLRQYRRQVGRGSVGHIDIAHIPTVAQGRKNPCHDREPLRSLHPPRHAAGGNCLDDTVRLLSRESASYRSAWGRIKNKAAPPVAGIPRLPVTGRIDHAGNHWPSPPRPTLVVAVALRSADSTTGRAGFRKVIRLSRPAHGPRRRAATVHPESPHRAGTGSRRTGRPRSMPTCRDHPASW